ncbi:MAG: AMP-binding protein, partial [Immundisolibacteraceae bacterium]|nr:AMP-binding protein [Immundisolibacteraceae bacterium]
AYGFCAGLFIVPLNSLIQFYAREGESGVVLAGNNFIQNIAMLVFLGLSIVAAQSGISTYWTLYALAFVALIGFVYALKQLPQSFVRYLVRGLLAPRYRLQVVNMDHMPRESGVLLLGNHVSWLDWAILQMASPRPIRFVMARSYYEKWYLRWFLDLFGVIPIAPGASKDALKTVHDALLRKEVVAIFPEGHISRNGHLSTFRSGFERAAEGSDAAIVPFYLHGLWGSQLSYSSGAYRRSSQGSKFSRLITVAFGIPLNCDSSATEVKQAVQETSIHAWDEHVAGLETLPASFIRTARSHARKVCVIDGDNRMTYGRLLSAVLAFRRQLQPVLKKSERVGILLPASAATVIANLSVLLDGRTIVNLNYTAPISVVTGCVEKARIKTVITSRLFLKKLEKRGLDLSPLTETVELIYMEDLRSQIPAWRFLLAFLQAKFCPTALLVWLYAGKVNMEDSAAILFSSGSEGTPKGVMLSHANIIANIKQVACVLNADDDDVMLNALPTFHAFGLTVTTLLPLIEAIPMVCQADPTDTRAVARLVAKHRVSIMIATATFLRMYVRSKKVHPLMFDSLRIVVTGAERLPAEVREGFRNKFGKTVFEGYGATETTPVATVNIPDLLLDQSGTVQTGNKPGSVGPPLPGTRVRIVDPDTLRPLETGEAGLVLIGGSQVMQGYLEDPVRSADAVVEIDGLRWYKTGDKGELDKDGFLIILDRYSRFAKLGGEMISLTSVEQQIAALIDDDNVELLAVALPEASKGEQIVMLIDDPDYADGLHGRVHQSEMSPMMRPKHYFVVDAIPKLGTGKTDLTRARQLATEALEEV